MLLPHLEKAGCFDKTEHVLFHWYTYNDESQPPFGKGGFLLDDDKTLFVSQPAKDFQSISLFRVKRLNETIHYSYSLQIWDIRDTFEQSW